MRFGAYIQNLREAAGLTQAQAARKLGISPQRLCDIEQGRRNFIRQPTTPLLRKISLVYDHPLISLLENTEFLQHEKAIVESLTQELEPILKRLDKTTLDMLLESRQYTPEMEALALRAQELTQALKTTVSVAKTRYLKGSKQR